VPLALIAERDDLLQKREAMRDELLRLKAKIEALRGATTRRTTVRD